MNSRSGVVAARVSVGLASMCAAVLLAGCQSTTGGEAGGSLSPISRPSVTSPTPSTTKTGGGQGTSQPVAPHSIAPSSPPSVASGHPECVKADVTVSESGSDAAAGHRRVVLVFTNHGSRTCTMRGYPGVAGLNAAGKQVAQATRTLAGYMGGLAGGNHPSTVVLAPGASASATVEALAFNAKDGTPCTAWAGLLVTVPDDVVSTHVGWGNDGCSGLEIHPVVPGTSGNA